MTTVFTVDGSSRYHLDVDCRALDSARLSTRGAVFQKDSDTLDHTLCLLCVDTTDTAWPVWYRH
ncbi:hypothetical protein BU198_34415 [Streptomyces sp. CBMA156]|nr:hypothetical protein [Streptomyces sp. CBMA156]